MLFRIRIRVGTVTVVVLVSSARFNRNCEKFSLGFADDLHPHQNQAPSVDLCLRHTFLRAYVIDYVNYFIFCHVVYYHVTVYIFIYVYVRVCPFYQFPNFYAAWKTASMEQHAARIKNATGVSIYCHHAKPASARVLSA